MMESTRSKWIEFGIFTLLFVVGDFVKQKMRNGCSRIVVLLLLKRRFRNRKFLMDARRSDGRNRVDYNSYFDNL